MYYKCTSIRALIDMTANEIDHDVDNIVNEKAGKIIEDLFTCFGVKSDLPFDIVAARLIDGKITMGSVLAKIKQMKEENTSKDEDVIDDRKTDDEIIDNVMDRARDARKTTRATDEPVTIANPGAPEDVTVKRDDAIAPGTTVGPEKAGTGTDGTIDGIKNDLGDELFEYMLETRENIAKILDEDTGERFLKSFDEFMVTTGNELTTGFGGNKNSVIVTAGYMIVKGIVGNKNLPLGSKKAFYEHFGMNATSCRRAEQKIGEVLNGH